MGKIKQYYLDKHEKGETDQVKIKCPNCGSIETGTIEYTLPWPTFIYNCTKCNYVIMESEWEEVSEKATNPQPVTNNK